MNPAEHLHCLCTSTSWNLEKLESISMELGLVDVKHPLEQELKAPVFIEIMYTLFFLFFYW